MIGPAVPCDAQFWIMSTYLPFGIALLQAANSQFLHVASQQQKYASVADLDELELSAKSAGVDPTLPWWKQTLGRVQRADRTARLVVYIGIAMVVELACVSLVAGHLVYSTNAAAEFSALPTYVIFVIGVPIWHIVKTHSLRRETLDAIASWEKKNIGSDFSADAVSASIALSGSTFGDSAKSANTKGSAYSGNSRRSDITMLALENALRDNPGPLLEFAALKDFSGENISFLSHVTDWRRGWVSSPLDPATLKYEQFIQAMRIYSHFISLECSQFPINISSRLAKELRETFDSASNMLYRREGTHSASATPFGPSCSSTTDLWKMSDPEGTFGKANLQSITRMADLTADGRPDVPVPDSFSPTVFDAAEGEIKYLVLTNTWPKFVHSGFESVSQAADGDERHFLDGIRQYLWGVERLG
ncbi:hypothetical protein DL766_009737 [Monosporascus sp. MC13-8B]|nr:hypothetical protein DL766_009737 [Monosporascus sp. MC13-8B]